jgi:hypothetical protein
MFFIRISIRFTLFRPSPKVGIYKKSPKVGIVQCAFYVQLCPSKNDESFNDCNNDLNQMSVFLH